MRDYVKLLEKVNEGIDRFAAEAIALSDDLAARPEISEQEFETSRKHALFLQRAGFEVEIPFYGIPTAYRGRIDKGANGRVALLAEYDALPEIGHACGHNVHGAMSLLAGAGLAPVMEELGGGLWVTGTPAEETNGAKITMAKGGLFDEVDLALMIHSGGRNSYARYRALAMDALEYRFKGRAAHAAGAPWEGRNALNGATLFFHAIDMLRQHVRPEVRMHGIISQGGAAPNIVPESATARFYFRAPWRSLLDRLVEKANNAARGVALATETEVEWKNFELSFDDVQPNETAESMMEEVFGEFGVPFGPCPGAQGSSDVGNVSKRCPALQPTLSIMDQPFAWHTREFAAATVEPEAHEALVRGARLLAAASLKAFLFPELRKRMWEDFRTEKNRIVL
ncbi:MAG: M20 family metallopeptidase [Synergistales bacterium]